MAIQMDLHSDFVFLRSVVRLKKNKKHFYQYFSIPYNYLHIPEGLQLRSKIIMFEMKTHNSMIFDLPKLSKPKIP
jgi:hypothetical protein